MSWDQLNLPLPAPPEKEEVTAPGRSWDGRDVDWNPVWTPPPRESMAPGMHSGRNMRPQACNWCACVDFNHSQGGECYCGCSKFQGGSKPAGHKKYGDMRPVFLAYSAGIITLSRALELVRLWDEGADVAREISHDTLSSTK